jgi:hypothetical protein
MIESRENSTLLADPHGKKTLPGGQERADATEILQTHQSLKP